MFKACALAQNQTKLALSMSQEGLGTIWKAIGFSWTVHVKASSDLAKVKLECVTTNESTLQLHSKVGLHVFLKRRDHKLLAPSSQLDELLSHELRPTDIDTMARTLNKHPPDLPTSG